MLSDYFLNMESVKELVLPKKIRQELYLALASGMNENLEHGGYITVKREGDICYAQRVIELPQQFRDPNHVFFDKIPGSRWSKFQVPSLFFGKLLRGSRIGFEWHTHAREQFEPCYAHEAIKTEKKFNNLGDLILEVDKTNKLFQYAYVKSLKQNYFRMGSEEDSEAILRKVSKVEIICVD